MAGLTRWALIHNNAILGVTDTDGGAPAPDWQDMTGAAGTVMPGATLVNGAWVAPAPVAPETVTNFQLRAALMQMPAPSGAAGTLFSAVDAAVHAQGGTAQQAWEYANDVNRTGPLVQQMAAAFGFDEAALDALFTAAAGISA